MAYHCGIMLIGLLLIGYGSPSPFARRRANDATAGRLTNVPWRANDFAGRHGGVFSLYRGSDRCWPASTWKPLE